MSSDRRVTFEKIITRMDEQHLDFDAAMDSLFVDEHRECTTICPNPTLTALSVLGTPVGVGVSFPPSKYCQRAHALRARVPR